MARTLRRRPERAFDAGLAIGALVALFAAVVIVQNSERSALDVLWWTWNTRLWTALAVALLMGIAVGLLLPRGIRRHRAVARERSLARKSLGQSG